MSDKVKFKKVIADNWESLVDLELGAGQEDLVVSNLYLVAKTQFDPHARARAVYTGKREVDFLMYNVQKAKGKAQEASIYRFMIDRKHQGKGYGCTAMSKALEDIRAIPKVNSISIRYMPENLVAKPFYAIFGFVEVRRDHDDEVIAVLKL